MPINMGRSISFRPCWLGVKALGNHYRLKKIMEFQFNYRKEAHMVAVQNTYSCENKDTFL